MRRSALVLMTLLTCVCAWVWALLPMQKDDKHKSASSAQEDIIILRHADRLYYNARINPYAQFLVGNVCFEHKGALMYCDSALYYKESKSFDAFDNVHLIQGDTLSLDGDVLYYDGMEQLARVRSRYKYQGVVMRHHGTLLYTDSLDYDRFYNIGRYFDGGRLNDGDNELTSDWGEYSPATRQAVFNYNVVLVNPCPPEKAKSTLLSDTLYYNTRTKIAHVVGPSNLENGNSHVYTENGYYYSQTDQSVLLDRSILTNVAKRMVGDSVTCDHKTHDNRAFGNIEYDDRENKNKFYGNYALYNDSTGYAEAADSAICIDYSQRDTAYAHADTFKVYTYNINTDSVYRMLHAYNHVRAYRLDMQGVCDSFVYNGKDSFATMYKDPIVWQDNQQILGEYIRAWVNDSTIDSVYVVNQALMVQRIDSLHFDQIASKEMHSYFVEGDLRLNVADVNVFTNYHPFDDDSLLIGMVHAESSQMKMYLMDKKMQKIWMPATTGQMFPLDQIPPNKRYLENFAWFDYIRPRDKDDIFEWRPKRAGTELKKTVLHEAPKQTLDDVKRKQEETKKPRQRLFTL